MARKGGFMVLIIALTTHCGTCVRLRNDLLPGFSASNIRPLAALPRVNDARHQGTGAWVLGQAEGPLAPPDGAFQEVLQPGGGQSRLPKGFYSVRDVEEEIRAFSHRLPKHLVQRGAALHLPNLSNPLSLITNPLGGRTKQIKRETVTNGLYLPLPFADRPINIQLIDTVQSGSRADAGLGAGAGGRSATQHARSGANDAPTSQVSSASLGHAFLDMLDAMKRHKQEERRRKMWRDAALELREYCAIYGENACSEAHKRVAAELTFHDQQISEPMDRMTRHITHNLVDVIMPAVEGNLQNAAVQKEIQEEKQNDGQNNVLAALGQLFDFGGVSNTKEDTVSNGALIDLPFLQKPLYLGTFLDNSRTDGYKLG